MKSFSQYYIFLTIAFITLLCACGGDDGGDPAPSETQRVGALLTTGTWKIKSVSVDGTDKSDLFKNMTLAFSANSFTASNAAPVWTASGTWSFVSDQAQSIKRDDNVIVELNTINETSLVVTLTWSKSTLNSGRTNSIAGKHVFTFSK